MDNSSAKVTPDFIYRIWMNSKRQDRILGIEESQKTRMLRQHGIIVGLSQVGEIANLVNEANECHEAIRECRKQAKLIAKKAKRTKEVSLANQYYQESSELLVKARTAAARLNEIEQKMIPDG